MFWLSTFGLRSYPTLFTTWIYKNIRLTYALWKNFLSSKKVANLVRYNPICEVND